MLDHNLFQAQEHSFHMQKAEQIWQKANTSEWGSPDGAQMCKGRFQLEIFRI